MNATEQAMWDSHEFVLHSNTDGDADTPELFRCDEAGDSWRCAGWVSSLLFRRKAL